MAAVVTVLPSWHGRTLTTRQRARVSPRSGQRWSQALSCPKECLEDWTQTEAARRVGARVGL